MKELLPILIPTAFPTLMVLVGILMNQKSVDRLDARISGLDARISGMDGRIDRMRDQHHSDMMLLMGAISK